MRLVRLRDLKDYLPGSGHKILPEKIYQDITHSEGL
jgi:hypothetical protein